MILLAHSGHWLVQVAYILPVAAFILWLLANQMLERRRKAQGDSAREEENPL